MRSVLAFITPADIKYASSLIQFRDLGDKSQKPDTGLNQCWMTILILRWMDFLTHLHWKMATTIKAKPAKVIQSPRMKSNLLSNLSADALARRYNIYNIESCVRLVARLKRTSVARLV